MTKEIIHLHKTHFTAARWATLRALVKAADGRLSRPFATCLYSSPPYLTSTNGYILLKWTANLSTLAPSTSYTPTKTATQITLTPSNISYPNTERLFPHPEDLTQHPTPLTISTYKKHKEANTSSIATIQSILAPNLELDTRLLKPLPTADYTLSYNKANLEGPLLFTAENLSILIMPRRI